MKFIYCQNEAVRLAKRNVAVESIFEALERWERSRWARKAAKNRQKTARILAKKGLL